MSLAMAGQTSSPKLRILMSAYGCGPGRGSEPGVGWNWALQAAVFHEVWVLTPERERLAIAGFPVSELPPDIHFIHIDMPRRIRPRSPGTTFDYLLHYHLWQIWAYFVARKLHKQNNFDLVHHVTLGAHWKPSLLSLLPVPFIWGPLGGAEDLPSSFWPFLQPRGRMREACRVLLRTLCEWDPLVRLTARSTDLALAKTEETARRLQELGCRHVRVESEAGLSESELESLGQMPIRTEGPLCFLSLGRLIYWKGFELSLRAFAKAVLHGLDASYLVVGDGPELPRLQNLAAQLGVGERVSFLGRLGRPAALQQLAKCDVLLHPSLHDSGGWACLEAMAAGRPVICLQHGGPGTQVTKETGFSIVPRSPEQTIEAITETMELLAGDRPRLRQMGLAARAYVQRNYAWNRKPIRSLYEPFAACELDRPEYCTL